MVPVSCIDASGSSPPRAILRVTASASSASASRKSASERNAFQSLMLRPTNCSNVGPSCPGRVGAREPVIWPRKCDAEPSPLSGREVLF